MKNKIIEFRPIENFYGQISECPKPAIKNIPDWYKNLSIFTDKNNKNIKINDEGTILSNITAKRCMPFFDAMTMGYVATLSADTLWVNPEDYNGNDVIWDVSYDLVGTHSYAQIGEMPVPYKNFGVYKWIFPFTIKTPPGYSCLFTHPKMHYDLPFTTIDGVVDTDTYNININFPFIMNRDFRGKIPKGTPICQIIPFKRDYWSMSEGDLIDEKQFYSRSNNLKSLMEKSYKKIFWQKKFFR